jgi:hypothetical protein
MFFTKRSASWPSSIKFVSDWPVIGSRLGDIGFLDHSGTWRKVLNILDEGECRANGIQHLRTNETAQLFSREPLDISTEHSLVKVSHGWVYNFLDTAELQM